MIGVIHAAAAVEQHLGVLAEDGVRPERSDLADELLPQRQVVLERAVRLVEKRNAFVADDVRRSPLL